MKWQGVGELRGLSGALQRCGASGKHKQNIKRDMLRALHKTDVDTHVSRLSLVDTCARSGPTGLRAGPLEGP